MTNNSYNTWKQTLPFFYPLQPKYNLNDPVHKKCDKRIRLVRKTLPGVFAFEYRLPTSTGRKTEISLSLSYCLIMKFVWSPLFRVYLPMATLNFRRYAQIAGWIWHWDLWSAVFANGGGGGYNATSYSSSSFGMPNGGPSPSPSGSSSSSTPAQLSLDLENDLPSVLQFNVGVNDIGGTLVAELAINQGRVSELSSAKLPWRGALIH